VLIEGGAAVAAAALRDRLVDEIVFYTAPLISGSGKPVIDAAVFAGGSVSLRFLGVEFVGPDVKLRAQVLRDGP
jgi:riboflavin biosynthesis pyrimidine reductase